MSESGDHSANIARWCKVAVAGLVVSVIGVYAGLTDQSVTQEDEPGSSASASPAAPVVTLSSTPLTSEAPIATPSIIEPGAEASDTPTPTYIPVPQMQVSAPPAYIAPAPTPNMNGSFPTSQPPAPDPSPSPTPHMTFD